MIFVTQGWRGEWGVEVEEEKTSGVLASCPLAAVGTHRSEGLFPEKAESRRVKYTNEKKRNGEMDEGGNPTMWYKALLLLLFSQKWIFVLTLRH